MEHSLFHSAFLLFFVFNDFVSPGKNPYPINLQYFGIIPAVASLLFFSLKKDPAALVEKIRNNEPSFPPNMLSLVENLTPDEKRLASFFSNYMSMRLVSWALNEAVVIFGLLAYITSGISKEQFLASFLTGLAMNLWMFPKVDSTFEEVRRHLQVP